MKKPANTDYEILPLLKERWSPRAFSNQPVEPEKLQRMFEAARWSPSCNNEQSWQFMVGIMGTPTHEAVLSCLTESNQRWAKEAPVLMITLARQTFADNGSPNPWAAYDLGQSMAYFTMQACAEKLYVHQMGGFDPQKAIEMFDIPEGVKPISAVAVGYYGDIATLPDYQQERETAPRTRFKSNEFVFYGKYGQKFDVLV